MEAILPNLTRDIQTRLTEVKEKLEALGQAPPAGDEEQKALVKEKIVDVCEKLKDYVKGVNLDVDDVSGNTIFKELWQDFHEEVDESEEPSADEIKKRIKNTTSASVSGILSIS